MSPCQLTCLAFALLVNFSSAEAFQGGQPTAFFSVRGGASRPFTRDSPLNVLDESVGEEQAVNGDIKQIRVTNGKRFGSTRMPAKTPPKNGFRNLPTDNISASAIASMCEVEDRPIPAEFVAESALPTDVGQFRLRAYRTEAEDNANEYCGREPSVIYAADKSPFGVDGKLNKGVHVRIHDQCLTSEVFGSRR